MYGALAMIHNSLFYNQNFLPEKVGALLWQQRTYSKRFMEFGRTPDFKNDLLERSRLLIAS